jgi:hypothetical protein
MRIGSLYSPRWSRLAEKVQVKRLKIVLTLDERVEIVLLSGRQGWTQRQVVDEFNVRHPELQTVVLLSIPIC